MTAQGLQVTPAAIEAEMTQARAMLAAMERQPGAGGRRAETLRRRLLALWAAKLDRMAREARAGA